MAVDYLREKKEEDGNGEEELVRDRKMKVVLEPVTPIETKEDPFAGKQEDAPNCICLLNETLDINIVFDSVLKRYNSVSGGTFFDIFKEEGFGEADGGSEEDDDDPATIVEVQFEDQIVGDTVVQPFDEEFIKQVDGASDHVRID